MTPDIPSPAEALSEMRRSAERSGRLYSYSIVSPYLFIAGAGWLAADLVFHFTQSVWAWPAASTAGTLLCVAVAVRQSLRRSADRAPARLDGWFWKGVTLWLMLIGFVMAIGAVFAPVSGVEIHTLAGLVSGFAYATLGVFAGWRLLATGLAIAVLSLAAHFFAGASYALLMGIIGGGGMMLGALWLRRV